MKKLLTMMIFIAIALVSCEKEDCMCENNNGQPTQPNNPIVPTNPDVSTDTTIVVPPIPDITKSLAGTTWKCPGWITEDNPNPNGHILEFLDDKRYRITNYKEGLDELYIKPIEEYEYNYPEITFHVKWQSNGLLMEKPLTQKIVIGSDNKTLRFGEGLYFGGDDKFYLVEPITQTDEQL